MSTPSNDWAEEVELWQEQEERRQSQAKVIPVIDHGMVTEAETSNLKDSVKPSTSETFQSEQVNPARAQSEPSVPPSGPCVLASMDGIGSFKLKKGEKLLAMDELRQFIQLSQQAITVRYVQSDIESSTTTSSGPWAYKNKKNTWVHYTVTINDVEVNNKLLL